MTVEMHEFVCCISLKDLDTSCKCELLNPMISSEEQSLGQ